MTSMPNQSSEDMREGVPVRLVLISVAITLLFASLGQTIVSPALPIITADLGGLEHLSWAITAYLLASTVAAPISGKLGDLYGRRIVMQGAIFVFVVGAIIGGTAWNFGMLIAGRAVQGMGAGSLIVLAMAVVADVLPARERGKAQGILGAAFGISTAIGPLLGGVLVETLGWHSIFFVNLPVGLAALIVLSIALPGMPGHGKRSIDYAGGALLALFLSSAVLISNMGGNLLPWASLGMAALIAVAIGSLVGFVMAERRAPEPILPLGLFTNNTFVVVNAVGFMVGTAMFGTITFLPLFLQVAKAVTPTVSGLFLLPMMAGLIVSSNLAGVAMARTGRYRVMPILSTGLLSVSMLYLATIDGHSSLWLIGAALLGVGIGLGPVFSIGVAAIQNAVPMSMLGVGTASANMFRLIGGAIGTALFGAIFAAGLSRNLEGVLPESAGHGLSSMRPAMVNALPESARELVIAGMSQALHPVFFIGAGMALLACIVSTRLKELPLATELPGR
ncbi:MFS transporter [Rhodobacterales bacterium HKCCE4037]|nr:MFS transporter [Rhodobacterales bacterium HKCCE4037]